MRILIFLADSSGLSCRDVHMRMSVYNACPPYVLGVHRGTSIPLTPAAFCVRRFPTSKPLCHGRSHPGGRNGNERRSWGAFAGRLPGMASSSSTVGLVNIANLEASAENEAEEQHRKRQRFANMRQELSPVPEQHHVVLNKPFGSEVQYVVNTTTLQKFALPHPGDWFLVFSEDGFAAAVDSSGQHDTVVMQSLFSRTLLSDSDGMLFRRGEGPIKSVALGHPALVA